MTSETPPGCLPFFMSNSHAEKCGLKSGPAIKDLIEFKAFKTEAVLEEISTYGFMCPFEPCTITIKECGREEFLVVCDPDAKHGEMFLLLHTNDSVENFLGELREKERVLAEEKEKEELAAAAEEAARKERENAEYVEVPMIPRPYSSTTMNGTAEEVGRLSIIPERPLMSVKITRPIRPARLDEKFRDRNNEGLSFSCGNGSDVFRLEQDVAVQAAPPMTSLALQTSYNRRTNKIVQCQPQGLEAFGQLKSDVLSDAKFTAFLRKSVPLIENALLENETLNIFDDALKVKTSGEVHDFVDSDDKDQIKERFSFTDLSVSKGKSICSIDWHWMGANTQDPMDRLVVAVSVREPISCDERIAKTGTVSSIILWKCGGTHPIAILHTPTESPCFCFNPTRPNAVVGGLLSGQVALWDIEGDIEDSDDLPSGRRDSRKPLKPIALSHPEHSHRCLVADIFWLPADTQVNARGQILSSEHLSKETNQFVTVSGDGHALFWDLRYNEIMTGKLPHIAKSKPVKQSNQSQQRWVPLLRIKVKRLEGAGELSLCKVLYPQKQNNDEGPRSRLVVTSEEGELIAVDWLPKTQTTEEQDTAGGALVSPEYVTGMATDHLRPCLCLAQSPFFPEWLLTVSDKCFHIWEASSKPKRPIFCSPNATTRLTGGQWSPTRPGVLFLSKVDGAVDVWDFTISSYSPCLSMTLIPNQITSMRFLVQREGEAKPVGPSLLAVGDTCGSLHLFEVSRTLSVPRAKEPEEVQGLFQRESMRLGNLLDDEDTKDGADHSRVENKKPEQEHDDIEGSHGLTEEEEGAYKAFEKQIAEQLGITLSCDEA